MDIVLILIVPFFFFSLLNCGICIISRRSFGECLPLALSIPVLIMYYFLFVLRSFNIGFYFLLALAIMSTGYIAIQSKKDKDSILKLILSPGMLAFITVYLFFFYFDFKRPFTSWDEMNHWGMMVKEILRTNRFYSEPVSHLIKHKEYPPFISIYQALWCKLSGSYSEMTVTLATHIFSFSLFFPLVVEKFVKEGEKWLAVIKSIVLFFTFLLGILFLDPYHIFMTIYMDVSIGLIFSLCMYLVYKGQIARSNFDAVCLAVMLTALLQVKQIGMAFFLVVFLYEFLNTVIRIKSNENGLKAPDFVRLASAFVFPVFNHVLWKIYVKQLKIAGQFDMDHIKFSEITNIISGKKEGLQHETYTNFIHQLFSTNLCTAFIPITFVTATIPVMVFIVLLYLEYKKYFDKKNAVILGVTLFLGAIGYAAVMMVLYLFCFEETEMRSFGSFTRYMASYVVGELILLILILFDVRYQKDAELAANKGKSKKDRGKHVKTMGEYMSESGILVTVQLLGILLIVAIISSSNIRYLIPQYRKGDPLENYRSLAVHLQNETEPESRVYLVAEGGGNDGFQVFISYLANDRIICYDGWGTLFPLSYDYESDPKMKDKILNEFGNNDYVYVINSNDNFNVHFSELNGGQPFEEGKVYKVVKDENGVISFK